MDIDLNKLLGSCIYSAYVNAVGKIEFYTIKIDSIGIMPRTRTSSVGDGCVMIREQDVSAPRFVPGDIKQRTWIGDDGIIYMYEFNSINAGNVEVIGKVKLGYYFSEKEAVRAIIPELEKKSSDINNKISELRENKKELDVLLEDIANTW
ncbi:MAG: hypothetical protein GY827_04555 [Cytophagales bacterium]|nr:hypothetical protein [Cytophagales bacterium]